MPTIEANGVHLYYEEQGHGAAILLIHGTSSSALIWSESTRQALAEMGRLIVYDRRGSTRSERPQPYTTSVAQHAADAIGLLDALGAGPTVLVGRSYGGAVALAAALSRSALVRALVLLEPGDVTLDGRLADWEEDMSRSVERAAEHDPATAAEVMIRSVLGDETWESLPLEWQEMFSANSPAVVAEVRGARLEVSSAELARIPIPVLLVVGASSNPAFGRLSSDIAAAVPDARSLRIEGGHIIDPGHPRVLAFIREILAEGA